MTEQEEIIDLIAKKYHLKPNEVRKAVDQQFKTCARIIRLKGAHDVRLPYIATFKKKKTKNEKNPI